MEGVLVACCIMLALPRETRAAEFTVWSQEVRVTGDAPGALVLVLNFWNRVAEVGFGRLLGGQWTYVVDYPASFKVLVYDLTEEELRDLELEVRLQRLEREAARSRARLKLICDRLGSRVAGCR
ncbi:MAG: hypothetical protein L0214_01925 [candidate division NC10 bacterium]|nr:hypothetical protein [candidate division NC10 bacterium]